MFIFKSTFFPTDCVPGALVHVLLASGALPGVRALAEIRVEGVDTGAAITTRIQLLAVISGETGLQCVQPVLEADHEPSLFPPPPLEVVIALHGLLQRPHSVLEADQSASVLGCEAA